MNPSVPPPYRFVMAAAGSCLYHCSSKTHPHNLQGAAGPSGWVYTCPAGTVSTVVFFGGPRRPSPERVRKYLQARLRSPERVRPRDLRAATRHGPELGRAAERWIDGPGTRVPLHLLYWRRYPRKVGRRYSYLYACFRHGEGEARFYPAPSSPRTPSCPYCRSERTGEHRQSSGRIGTASRARR